MRYFYPEDLVRPRTLCDFALKGPDAKLNPDVLAVCQAFANAEQACRVCLHCTCHDGRGLRARA